MGKPQSNFQYRTIFGVPLIAGNVPSIAAVAELLKFAVFIAKHENPHFLYTMLSAAFLSVELLNYKQ